MFQPEQHPPPEAYPPAEPPAAGVILPVQGQPYPPSGPLPQPASPPGPGFTLNQPQQYEVPTAPPISQLGFRVQGYEESGYDRKPIPPPDYHASGDHGQGSNLEAFKLPKIEEQDVVEALRDHVNNKWCWGSQPIDNIKIKDIKMSSSYHYHLDTFTEQRETAWTFVPHDAVANPVPPQLHILAPPSPWSVDVRPDKEFADAERKIEVPNSSTVRACHDKCAGTGRLRCDTCNGTGNTNCKACAGKGIRNQADGSKSLCPPCAGSGRVQCTACGAGLKKCPTCKGFGNVRFFIELHVKWRNHDADFVSDASGLKKKYIKKVKGRVALEFENIRIYPLQSFPDRSIVEASQKLIEKHSKDYPMERILKQKHSVKVVPVASVNYDHKSNNGIFYVYGDGRDRGVYFNEYPARFCYGCSIA